MIDAHCHFDLCPDPIAEVERLERMGIATIGMTNLPSHFELGFKFTRDKRFVRLALGMHPLLVQQHQSEIARFKQLIDKTSYIGEVGLDFSKEGISSKAVQEQVFNVVLGLIRGKKKILSIHSRKAEKEVLQLLRKHGIRNAIFHWYSGSIEVLKELVALGYLVSVNPAMLKSKHGRKIVDSIPLDSILTETDAPYGDYRGVTVKPGNVELVLEYLADLHHIEYAKVESLIRGNFTTLIRRISS